MNEIRKNLNKLVNKGVLFVIVDSNTYNYESTPAVNKVIEGENFAVFGTDRTHISTPYHVAVPETDIYSLTDCHYDVTFSTVPTKFGITSKNSDYTEGTLLTVSMGSSISIDVQ